MRVFAAVEYGVSEALKRHAGEIKRNRPSFFIFSRYGGDHWAEWVPEDCPYYPCHFPGQRCDYCYCPFYPCMDESLGEWVQSSHNGRVWNCSGCTLLHLPHIADYLGKNPEASLNELKALERCKKRVEFTLLYRGRQEVPGGGCHVHRQPPGLSLPVQLRIRRSPFQT